MKIIYAHDNVYFKDKDGVYSAGQFSYEYWTPYLEAFGQMTVLGRTGQTDSVSDMNRADGKGIDVLTFPNMNSIKGQLFYKKQITSQLKQIIQDADGVIIRAMSEIGWEVYKLARENNLPIVHEMSGCPWDNTWNHGSLSAKLYAPLRHLRAKKVARTADQVLYVTRDFLPNRYPAIGRVVIASNVRIQKPTPEVLGRRYKRIEKRELNFGLIGHLDHKLKGIDIAMVAFANFLKQTNHKSRFRILGPGNKEKYIKLAKELRIENYISFEGILPAGQAVLEWLDSIDIYMQPSFHEGLPRALIESMSRGCPALASTAGGIAELLPEHFMHRPGDHKTLTQQMVTLSEEKETRLKEIAKTNFDISLNYTAEKLMPKRKAFWADFAKLAKSRKS